MSLYYTSPEHDYYSMEDIWWGVTNYKIRS